MYSLGNSFFQFFRQKPSNFMSQECWNVVHDPILLLEGEVMVKLNKPLSRFIDKLLICCSGSLLSSLFNFLYSNGLVFLSFLLISICSVIQGSLIVLSIYLMLLFSVPSIIFNMYSTYFLQFKFFWAEH